jgi:hypothetical protein
MQALPLRRQPVVECMARLTATLLEQFVGSFADEIMQILSVVSLGVACIIAMDERVAD